jgi:hypothetical protein
MVTFAPSARVRRYLGTSASTSADTVGIVVILSRLVRAQTPIQGPHQPRNHQRSAPELHPVTAKPLGGLGRCAIARHQRRKAETNTLLRNSKSLPSILLSGCTYDR